MQLGVTSDRLAFTPGVLFEVRRLCVDLETLVKRYIEKTKGRRIKDPSAYLLRMAREVVAKRDGVSVGMVAMLTARDPKERAAAMAEAVGVKTTAAEAELRHRKRMGAPSTNGAALVAALRARAS
jgi:hypothetical protein